MVMKRRNRKEIIIFSVMTVIALAWIVPIFWILFTSLKSEAEAITGGFSLLPKEINFDAYKEVLFLSTQAPVLRWFLNSLIIAITHTALVLTISSLAGFAYARLEFKGRDKIFYLLLSTMMVPPVVNLIPLYKITSIFGWVDTYWAMIFPAAGGVYGVFLLRQFMLGISSDYDNAARIDGASNFYIFIKIIIPMIKPALIVLALFTFMGNWNDFLWPTIVTNDVRMRTLPAGMRILQGVYDIEYAKLMAATVVSATPVFIIYLFVQKYFIKGISLSSGIKG
jgi:multiple sugar transport system permease protein